MNHADIKVGKYYTLQLLCTLNAEKVIVFGTASGDHIPLRQCDLECVTPITPSEPPTLVGPAPKHSPCRNPHLMDDLRTLAAALRFDNQHANAELIAQTVSILESIQITAA